MQWQSVQTTLVVLPTGAGKTRLASALILDRKEKGKALFICHMRELVWQAAEHIKKVTGLTVGIEMGDYKVSSDGLFSGPQVVVASVQTLCVGGDGGGRMSKFLPEDFATIIADECHRAVSPSWKKAINYFLQNKNSKLLGISATPDRLDEEALGQVFETVSYEYEIYHPSKPSAIRDGWLVPVVVKPIFCNDLDYSGIRTTAGDLNGKDLDEVLTGEKPVMKWVTAIVEAIFGLEENSLPTLTSEWDAFIGGRKFKRLLAFTSSVNHAKLLCEILNRVRPGLAMAVDGKTDKDERKMINADYAAGKFAVLCNCATHMEGFDDSGIEFVLPKPTKSRSANAQMCGRGTRPHSSIANALNDLPSAALRRMMIARSCKPCCTILDIHGNFGRHKLSSPVDILGGNISDDVVLAATEFSRKTGKPMPLVDLVEEEEKRKEERKQKELAAAARKAKLLFKASYKTGKVDPFDVLDIKPTVVRGWEKGKQLSEGQKNILTKHLGLNPDDFTYHQAKQILDKQFEIWNAAKEGGYHACSFKMIKTLKKYGVDATSLPIERGKAALDAIAKNGWRGLPEGFKLKPSSIPPPPSNQPVINSDDPF